MATVVNYEHEFCDDYSLFRTTGGKLFVIMSFNDGIMVIRSLPGVSLDSLAQTVAGCFEDGSSFQNLKAIEFDFNDIPITVTRENATPEKIIEQWERKMEPIRINCQKRPLLHW